MTTTPTRAVTAASFYRNAYLPIERAHSAYGRASMLDQPGTGAHVTVINDVARIALVDVNGDLDTYELRGTRVKRIDTVAGVA